MDQPTNDQLIGQLGVATGTFAAKIAEVSGAAMASDQQSQMAHLAYVEGVGKLSPLVVDQEEDLGFGLGTVSRRDSRPAITAIKMDRVGFEDLKMRFNMRVASQTEKSTETDVKVGSKTETEVSGGWLFARAKVKQTITADVRHNNKQTRNTDMSAEVEIEATLGRIEAPEGLQLMMDTANEFSRETNKLRMLVAQAKVKKLIQQIEDGEVDAEKLEAQGTGGGGKPGGKAGGG